MEDGHHDGSNAEATVQKEWHWWALAALAILIIGLAMTYETLISWVQIRAPIKKLTGGTYEMAKRQKGRMKRQADDEEGDVDNSAEP